MADDTDTDGPAGAESIVAGAIVLGLIAVLVVGIFLARRDRGGPPPRELLGNRVASGQITQAQRDLAEQTLKLDADDAPSTLDEAMDDLNTRRSTGGLTDEEFWRTRDALGR